MEKILLILKMKNMLVYTDKLNALIIKCAEYSVGSPLSSLHNKDWDDFIASIHSFIKYYEMADAPEYKKLNRELGHRRSSYDDESIFQNILECLLNLRKYSGAAPNFFDRVFISHSGSDLPIVKPFVSLLNKIGLDKTNLFCSSVENYGIPIGQNIYEYLKREFTHKNIFVIMMLSENYYDSKPSLNEMGATWVMSKDYATILLRGFDFKGIEGSVDPRRIGFAIEDKSRLDEFKDKLIKELRIENVGQDWIVNRDIFLKEIEGK